MKKILTILVLLPMLVQGQPAKTSLDKPSADIGFGLGLDYGGFGGRFTFYPEKHIGLFGSLGYNLLSAGHNFGARFRFNPDSKVSVVAGGMYGYNAVIKVDGAPEYDRVYYGPSIFGGGELHLGVDDRNYFSFELLVPFRPQSFTNDYNSLKGNSSIKFKNDILPIGISLGYHVKL